MKANKNSTASGSGKMLRGAIALSLVPAILATLVGCGSNDKDATADGDVSQAGNITKNEPLTTKFEVDETLRNSLPPEIREKGTVKVATLGTNAPIVFKNENDKMMGSAPDFWNAFEQILDIKLESQVYSNTGASLTAVDSGQADIAWGSDADTEKRQAKYDFVDYFAPSYSIYVQGGNPLGIKTVLDICGHSYAGIQGSVSVSSALNERCVAAGKSPVDEKLFDDAGSALLAIASGQVESWLYFNYFGVWQKAQGTPLEIIPTGDDFKENMAFGVVIPKGDDQLTTTFLKVFEKLKESGYYDEVLKRWSLSDLATKPGINIGHEFTLWN